MNDPTFNSDFQIACQRGFEELHRRLDRLDEAIRGNGQAGIKLRLDRLERSAKTQSRLAWLIIGAGIAAAASDVVAFVTR